MFDIDYTRYRLVDLSRTIDPAHQPGDRPFRISRSFLADNSFKHEIETHSHVGAHVEFPAHFFEDGKDGLAFDLDRFAGRAVLFDIDAPPAADCWITADTLDSDVGGILEPGDILVLRNISAESRRAATTDRSLLPGVTRNCAEWIRDHKVKLLGLDERYIALSKSLDQCRAFHDVLLAADICFIEGMDNLEALRRKTFFLFAFPAKVKGLDSAFARVVAVEEK